MLARLSCLPVGLPDPFRMDNGKTLYYLNVVADNPDGSNEVIQFRSYDHNFSDVPLKQPIVIEGDVKLFSKDKGKTTSLELQSYKLVAANGK